MANRRNKSGPVATAMRHLRDVVREHFPDALDPLLAALGVIAVGAFKDNKQPTTLILVGTSSSGKTMVLSWLLPIGKADPLSEHIYRSDSFTAQSFVTHKADCKEKELKKIDLLPRLKGKTLITKELAPIFHGKSHELVERFARLTTVLDGMGYISDSGAQGRRGYAEPINFQWLGATTELSPAVFKVIAQLGPRMLFYRIDRPRSSVDALAALVLGADNEAKQLACRDAVRRLLVAFYEACPPNSRSLADVSISEEDACTIARWAQLISVLRGKPPRKGGEDAGTEQPERVALMLATLARGSALIHERTEVADYDLKQVAHIALSAGSRAEAVALYAALRDRRSASTPDARAVADVSAPTIHRAFESLERRGLGRITEATGNRPKRFVLAAEWRALADAPLLKAKRGEGRKGSVR